MKIKHPGQYGSEAEPDSESRYVIEMMYSGGWTFMYTLNPEPYAKPLKT